MEFAENNMFFQAYSVPDLDVINVKEFLTQTIDLNLKEEAIFDAFKANYKNEIRRAEKEGISFVVVDTPSEKEFLHFNSEYNRFCAQKNLVPLGEDVGLAYIKSGKFIITRAMINDQEILTHTYVHDAGRIRLYTSSHNIDFADEKLRGWANKYLHWKDIQYSINSGYKLYDLGGLDFVNTPGISKFKIGFGGYEEKFYEFSLPSGKYKLIKKLTRLLKGK
ncbi:MAG: peptidoglycan bridge formation glycyltransferase FemA/FemB family protein [Bacteroidetes bacterium]|nr:peptidoglycan bridge formation glycyltransferase FemA/FemB family protein [Bacteroidota bacterium]